MRITGIIFFWVAIMFACCAFLALCRGDTLYGIIYIGITYVCWLVYRKACRIEDE